MKTKRNVRNICLSIYLIFLIIILLLLFVRCAFFIGEVASDIGLFDNISTKQVEWIQMYYLDEFEQYTDELFITNKKSIYGTYNDSPTKDANAYMEIYIDRSSAAIQIYRSPYDVLYYPIVSEYYYKIYDITLLNANNQKQQFSASIPSGGDRLYLSEEGKEILVEELKKSGTIKLYIERSDNSIENYLFEFDNDGSDFVREYNFLK